MNVFEDLIVELKEENLLEKTVIDLDGPTTNDDRNSTGSSQAEFDQALSTDPETASKVIETIDEEVMVQSVAIEAEALQDQRTKPNKRPNNGRDFYHKRAVAEISNLQMVEHVLTGVEREYMKVVPKSFDDFNAKKTLNAFLLVTEDENSEEHTQAEFKLMQETEAWCSALDERDRKVPVSSLRLYCENSRPPLSSQALLALTRFYRNLPYSEAVRAKFDFTITRLFSKPSSDNKRECLFSREEILANINKLYNDWSSIALYGADDDESNMLLTALSFEDLADEIESNGSFDKLVESDFFGRLRLFKESVNEMFYAPMVTATAVETNVRIGNAYVNLIERERHKLDAESIESKYADFHGDSVSDAAGRTLDLTALLRTNEEPIPPEPSASEQEKEAAVPPPISKPKPEEPQKPAPWSAGSPAETNDPAPTRVIFFGNFIENAKAMNKGFLAISAILVLVSFGLYFFSDFAGSESVSKSSAMNVELDNAVMQEHLKAGRRSGEMFYGMLNASWDGLTKEKRLAYLQSIYAIGREKGFRQVTLVGTNGKNVAYASATRMDVDAP